MPQDPTTPTEPQASIARERTSLVGVDRSGDTRFSARPLPSFLATLHHTLRWLGIAIPVGLLAGTASALLLVALDWATRTRDSHPELLYFLPLAGLAVGLLYHFFGQTIEAGNNLLLEEIHAEADTPATTIPARMSPLILLGTVLTHLFGGSAGREGTAVQTGASLADQLTPLFRRFPRLTLASAFTANDRRILLMSGIAAGFASVFGTPLAGTVFGVEVLTVGSIRYEALFPCLATSFIADLTTRAWGIHHTIYLVDPLARATPISPITLLAAVAAGIAFGLTALAFARLTHAIGALYKRIVAFPPFRPLLGGAIVAVVVLATHAQRYIGLGIPTIVASFHQPVPRFAFASKLALTALTLGAGFKGGEVTPLFFIGATLGNALAGPVPLPASLLAAMGFVAVFAGAANTPLASTLMAFELFGAEAGTFAAIACITSYLFSGHHGIYHAQRPSHHKHGQP